MSFLSKLTVKGKLAASFGTLFMIMLAVGGTGLYQAGELNAAADRIGKSELPTVRILGEIGQGMTRYRQL